MKKRKKETRDEDRQLLEKPENINNPIPIVSSSEEAEKLFQKYYTVVAVEYETNNIGLTRATVYVDTSLVVITPTSYERLNSPYLDSHLITIKEIGKEYEDDTIHSDYYEDLDKLEDWVVKIVDEIRNARKRIIERRKRASKLQSKTIILQE